jgi:hypothetical protein
MEETADTRALTTEPFLPVEPQEERAENAFIRPPSTLILDLTEAMGEWATQRQLVEGESAASRAL